MKKLGLCLLSILLLYSNVAYSKSQKRSHGYGLVQSYESRLFGWLRHFLPEYNAALQNKNFHALPDIARTYSKKAKEVGGISFVIAELLAQAGQELSRMQSNHGAKNKEP